MNSPSISVVVAGAIRSAARLVVVLLLVARAYVKGGEHMACRHNLIFAQLWCVFEHSLPSVGIASLPSHYGPMMSSINWLC